MVKFVFLTYQNTYRNYKFPKKSPIASQTMKIKLIQVGKTEQEYLLKGIADYKKRLEHYTAVAEITIKSPVSAIKQGAEIQKKAECELFRQQITPDEMVYLLDEKGKDFSSVEFAGFLSKLHHQSVKKLTFCIGGPFGFSNELEKLARGKISFSRMTFSHQMIRLFFWEQMYRAHTILKGEKYHNN